jgi:hypothetical protein
MNHSKPYWQRAEDDNPQYIIEEEPSVCQADFSESDVGEFIRSTNPFDRIRRNRRSHSDNRLFGGLAHRLFGGPPDVEYNVGREIDYAMSETTYRKYEAIYWNCGLTMAEVIYKQKRTPSDGKRWREKIRMQQLYQSDLFHRAGEEFAPSLEPCAVTGAIKNAMRYVTFALKNNVDLPARWLYGGPARLRSGGRMIMLRSCSKDWIR